MYAPTVSATNTTTGANYTLLPPSQRNSQSGNNCVENIGDPESTCKTVHTWNATHPTYCTGGDPGKTLGICDPTDHNCYAAQDIFSARSTYRQYVHDFITSTLINYFDSLDKYVACVPQYCYHRSHNLLISSQGPNAVNLYAKGAVAYIGMLQQLIILGSGSGENTTMTTFAGRAAAYLQQQYDFFTNTTNMLHAVQASSDQPFVNGIMETRSACNELAVLDQWDGTQVMQAVVFAATQNTPLP